MKNTFQRIQSIQKSAIQKTNGYYRMMLIWRHNLEKVILCLVMITARKDR